MRAALALVLLAATAALAQPLYKWTDAQGKVHYGDRPPKGFKGTVEQVDVGAPETTPVPASTPAAPAPKPPAAGPAKAEPMVDVAARRRATRERLQAAVDAARGRLDQAEAALKAGEAPGEDERQVIQQVAGGPGSLPASGRSNCRKTTNAQGKEVTMCPAVIPSPQYYERVKGLEDAVKAAQLELERAREAYRRGVD